jgi:adenylate cyclase
MTVPESWRPLAEALLGVPELTSTEVAREAGLDFDEVRRLWRALGLPPVPEGERRFTRADVEVLRGVRQLVERQGTDPRVLVQLTRVTGQSLARIADAQVSDAAERVRPRTQDAAGEEARAELLRRIEILTPTFDRLLAHVWRHHLVAALLRLSAMPSAADRSLVVGFADLVGFTTVSRALDTRELADMVDRFEAVAYEQIVERGGRVVKMIGDEVMFAVEDAVTAAETALALVEAIKADEALPDVRVGLASGPVLAWEGDLYGPTVNLASRLVNLARAGAVLVSDELGAALGEHADLTLRHLRHVNLRGIGRVRPWVLRRGG